MNQHHYQGPHDILVAASIAQQYGFTQTQLALHDIAKCATCPQQSWCSGGDCLLNREETPPPPLQ